MQASSPPTPWNTARAQEIIARSVGLEGPLLPVLHDLQAEFGCVPDEAVQVVAEALNLSRADVHGVLTFYHDFRRAPAGARVLKLCRAEACQARGGRATEQALKAALKVGMGETTGDGALTLEPVYCLGLCASGPSALLDGAPVARLSGERLQRLIDEVCG
jgi:formate dehydrogenase subunit gamma